MMKKHKIEKYKMIAMNKMIEVVGKGFIRNHIDHIVSSWCDKGEAIEITFLIVQPSEIFDNCIKTNDENTIDRYFSVIINKKTKMCIKVDNHTNP